MLFGLKLNLSLSVGSGAEQRSSPQKEKAMGSLAQQAAEKLAQSTDSRKERAKLASERLARIRSEAPYLWDKLKEILAEEIGDFNKLGQGNISLKQERITLEMKFSPLNELTKTEVHAAFDAGVPVVNFKRLRHTDAYPAPEEGSTLRLTFDADPDLANVGFRYPGSALLTVYQGAGYLFNMLFE
jgi:hypothetical protein